MELLFGVQAGLLNWGSNNSFFGNFSGLENTSGNGNSFFGIDAGRNNTAANNNAFFGANSACNDDRRQ
ncbi:MAG: hypothetical protein IPJ30_16490 [Acidobacteria bacterium]|nr:hypothetical protein [Acidobacteriota bacterium]